MSTAEKSSEKTVTLSHPESHEGAEAIEVPVSIAQRYTSQGWQPKASSDKKTLADAGTPPTVEPDPAA